MHWTSKKRKVSTKLSRDKFCNFNTNKLRLPLHLAYWRHQEQQQHDNSSKGATVRPATSRSSRVKNDMWSQVVSAGSSSSSIGASSCDFAATAECSEIELLCSAIYERGEKYEDGTGAIPFRQLQLVSRSRHVTSIQAIDNQQRPLC